MLKRKVVFSFVFAAFFVLGCKFSNGAELSAPQNEVAENPRLELLTDIAETGSYKVSEEKVKEDLAVFLQAVNSSSAGEENALSLQEAAAPASFEISKIEEFKCEVVDTRAVKTMGVSEAKIDNIDFYLYKIKNSATGKSGYAVTSGDRRIGEILAVVEEGDFEADISDNPFMQIFRTNLEAYINETLSAWYYLKEAKQSRSVYEDIANSGEYTYSAWEYHRGYCRSLKLSTNWGQLSPYNEAIKAVYNKDYVTGCSTTAIAQILAYHKYPETCSAKILKKLKEKWNETEDWDGKYDWYGMTRRSDVDELEYKHRIQVAALMYEVAEGLHSKYKEKTDKESANTSAYTSSYRPFLLSAGYKTDWLTDYSFDKVKKSINNKYPVLISGRARYKKENKKSLYKPYSPPPNNGIEDVGHLWVIDGYAKFTCTATNTKTGTKKRFTENYVHCNLGWSGIQNGYYISGVFSVNIGPLSVGFPVIRVTVPPDFGYIRIDSKNNSTFSLRPGDARYYYRYDIEIMTNIHPK